MYILYEPWIFLCEFLLAALVFTLITVGILSEGKGQGSALMDASRKGLNYNSNYVYRRAGFGPSFYWTFSSFIFETKAYRRVEVRRDLWRLSDPPPLLKQDRLKPVAQEHVQRAFKYLQGRRLHHLSGQPPLSTP